MQTIDVYEAESHLAELIDNLSPGDQIVLTRDDKPIATIRATPVARRASPKFGTLKGTILYIAPDFDEIPEGFEDYLP
jgi:antitoxin (DNA-binding transcriptional repressor) of toxin-antitoxin stability system